MEYIPRLKEEYKNRVISALKEEWIHKRNASSKIGKIVLSRGVGVQFLIRN
jgi:large subunit ribosomal protein L5